MPEANAVVRQEYANGYSYQTHDSLLAFVAFIRENTIFECPNDTIVSVKSYVDPSPKAPVVVINHESEQVYHHCAFVKVDDEVQRDAGWARRKFIDQEVH